jgi:acetaldehyde dehydrogenase / alcohol dehydrogenase
MLIRFTDKARRSMVISPARFPPPLDALSAAEIAVLERCITTVQYPASACIFKEGSAGDACYIIDQGTVRIELERAGAERQSEIDTDTTLAYTEAGELLGELSLLDRLPRSASAYAHTAVTARRIGTADVEQMAQTHPRVGMALYAALGRDASRKLRRNTERLAHAIFGEAPDPAVDAMVSRAAAAQKEIEAWPEDRIDALLASMAHAVAGKAEDLAAAAVRETGLGNVPSKVQKDRLYSLGIYSQLSGKPGLGLLTVDPERNVREIACPVGVVFALGPVTNPVSTFIFKALICVKSRNAVIFSPNRRAVKVAEQVEDLIKGALRQHGAPLDLVQCVRGRTSRKTTAQFMAHEQVSLILATVKAAYSSGTPAIGVGAGNTPVLVCSDADVPRTVYCIRTSKPFDNGTPCGAEHNLVVVAALREAFVRECEKQGVAVLSADEVERFTPQVVRQGRFKLTIVGRPAAEIAAQAGIRRDYPIQLIVIPTEEVSEANPYAHEKMAPMLSLFTVPDEAAGMKVCRDLLMIEGCGHTAVIYTDHPAWTQQFGDLMPASRILVNTSAVYGMLGLTTGLSISATLGCGTFGGTSTTDNVTHVNVRNVKRMAQFLPAAAELWKDYLPPPGPTGR